MRVRDLLKGKPSSLIAVEPKTDLVTAVGLLTEHNIGGLPVVVPGGRTVGFVAEREIVLALGHHGDAVRHLKVDEVMRPASICTIDDTVEAVMSRMTRQRLRHLVVEEDDLTVGVISVGDLVKHRLDQLETETGVLRDYVAAQRAHR